MEVCPHLVRLLCLQPDEAMALSKRRIIDADDLALLGNDDIKEIFPVECHDVIMERVALINEYVKSGGIVGDVTTIQTMTDFLRKQQQAAGSILDDAECHHCCCSSHD